MGRMFCFHQQHSTIWRKTPGALIIDEESNPCHGNKKGSRPGIEPFSTSDKCARRVRDVGPWTTKNIHTRFPTNMTSRGIRDKGIGKKRDLCSHLRIMCRKHQDSAQLLSVYVAGIRSLRYMNDRLTKPSMPCRSPAAGVVMSPGHVMLVNTKKHVHHS